MFFKEKAFYNKTEIEILNITCNDGNIGNGDLNKGLNFLLIRCTVIIRTGHLNSRSSEYRTSNSPLFKGPLFRS